MRSGRSFILAFVGCYLALFVLTLRDYGITCDSALGGLYLGDKYFYFLTSFDPQYLDVRRDNISIYGKDGHPDFYATSGYAQHRPAEYHGLGLTLTSLTKQVFFVWLRWLDPIDAHHLAIGLLVAVQLLCLFLFCRRYFGTAAAAGAVICLAVYPRYWAHTHNNPKDIPEAVFFTLTLLALAHGVYARRVKYVLLAGVACGLALATKGNALFLPVIVVPWLAAVAVERRQRAEPMLDARSLLAMVACVPLAAAVCLVAWPYLLADFPHHVLRFARFLFEVGLAGPDHWQSLPLQNGLYSMPIAVMLLALAGTIVLSVRALKGRIDKSLWLLLGLWLLVPLARVSIPRAWDFSGIRHWIEFVPALAILSGIGLDWIARGAWRWLSRRRLPGLARQLPEWAVAGVVAVSCYLPVVSWNVRNHPFQIAYFNRLIGGLAGAQARHFPWATDYWGSSYRTGLRWLNAHAERRAALVVAAEPQVVRSVQEIWLRPDIRLRPSDSLPGLMESRLKGERARPLYVMYITVPELYDVRLEPVIDNSAVVYEIKVDDGVILRILKLKGPAAPG